MQNMESRTVDALSDNAKQAPVLPDEVPFRFHIRVDDEAAFSMAKVCAIRHNYHEHPLMQFDSLKQLAKSLMRRGLCRFIPPGSTQASQFSPGVQSFEGRTIDEIFRRIEEPGSWIALYHVETDPLYGRFLEEALGTVRHLIDRQEPGLFNAQGFMFISAPPSVTPFHIDRENNFWLQIRGRKTINVWDPTDREAVAARDVEEFITTTSLRGVRLSDEIRARSHEFDTGPGDGVYFPSTSPHTTRCDTHWARPGDGVSISIGIVFYTSVTQRHANVHAFNKVLRRIGMNPRWPGTSAWADRLKYPLGRIVVNLQRRLRRYSPPAGF